MIPAIIPNISCCMLGTNKQLGGKRRKPVSVPSKKTMDANGDASTTTSAKEQSKSAANVNITDSMATDIRSALQRAEAVDGRFDPHKQYYKTDHELQVNIVALSKSNCYTSI
jgi:hypothetical protein